MSLGDWLWVAPLMAAFGALFYVTMALVAGHPFGEAQSRLARAITVTALSGLLDLFFVVPRIASLSALDVNTSVPVVLEGFLCWMAFSVGMGLAAFVRRP